MYSGYGGLGMALRAVSGLPVRTLWHCDLDPDCDATLARHHPGVPNLAETTGEVGKRRGDTAPDWSTVERPDVLTLGPPCQPVSAAGRGLGADDPRWRWPYARHAVELLGCPPVLFFENVERLTQGVMRPLWDGILTDMRDLGYRVAWVTMGACLGGAPQHRHRVFAVGRQRPDAGPAVRVGNGTLCGVRDGVLLPSPVARDGDRRGEGGPDYWARRRLARPAQGIPLGAAVRLLPTATAGDSRRGPASINSRGEVDLAGIVALLPTPVTTDARGARNSTATRSGAPGSGGSTLGDVVYRGDLLPTPRASDAANGGPNQGIASGDVALSSAVTGDRYGRYAAAVERWERITGVPAPDPVEPTGRGGGWRLAPALPEWMHGLPAGYLTGHLGRAAAIRLAGNGVVPMQAAAAFRMLWTALDNSPDPA